MSDDPINPRHYTSHPSGVEAIELTEQLSFNVGNIVKYVLRDGKKPGNERDAEKAAWYARREQARRGDYYLGGASDRVARVAMSIAEHERPGSLIADMMRLVVQDDVDGMVRRLEDELERRKG